MNIFKSKSFLFLVPFIFFLATAAAAGDTSMRYTEYEMARVFHNVEKPLELGGEIALPLSKTRIKNLQRSLRFFKNFNISHAYTGNLIFGHYSGDVKRAIAIFIQYRMPGFEGPDARQFLVTGTID